MRARRSGWRSNEVTRNRWVWGALILCLALVGLAVHWSAFATVLSLTDPGRDGWALAFALSLIPLLVGQISLAIPLGDSSIRRPVTAA